MVTCHQITHASGQPLSQTRTTNRVTIHHNADRWLNKSPASLADDDNVHAYTKTTVGQHPIFTDYYKFAIPVGARIDKIVAAVRKFKTGKNVVNDLSSVTWFTKGCCHYGPSMPDPRAWATAETEVIYQQLGSGTDDAGRTYSWTWADINSELFGFTFNPTVAGKGSGAAIYIDQITITVFYTLATQPFTTTTSRGSAVSDAMLIKRPNESMVYPNPTTQKTTLAYTASETTTTLIQLYSMQGTLLWTHNGGKVLKGLLYQQLLDLSGLPVGSYVYKLTSGTKVQKGIITKTE